MRVTWLGGSPPLVEPTSYFSFKEFAKFFLTHSKFCQKMRFEASQVMFWSLLCHKGSWKTYHKAIYRSYTAFWSRYKILACKVWACTESKILRVLKWERSLDFYSFTFSPPFLFLLFYLIFFPLSTGHLVGLILVGKVFWKAFRILELIKRKGKWEVKQDFHEIFLVNVTRFFAFFFFCPWLSCVHSGMIWKISSLCTR